MSPVGRFVRRFFGGLHVRLFRLTGGAIGGRIGKAPVLLLTTVGRRTGKERVMPLLYLVDGDRHIVVASNGGAPNHPAWFLNLKARPEVAIQVKRSRQPVRARVATSQEREGYWPKLVEIYRPYDSYRAKTTREIPVVVLEPRGD